MRARIAVVLGLIGAGGVASADPLLDLHLQCFHGLETTPLAGRREITDDISCRVVVSQGTASANVTGWFGVIQTQEDGNPHTVPLGPFLRVGRGGYFSPSGVLHPSEFKRCKDVELVAFLDEDKRQIWSGRVFVPAGCPAAPQLPVSMACRRDATGVACELAARAGAVFPDDAVAQVHPIHEEPRWRSWDGRAMFAQHDDDKDCIYQRFEGTVEDGLGRTLFHREIAVPCAK